MKVDIQEYAQRGMFDKRGYCTQAKLIIPKSFLKVATITLKNIDRKFNSPIYLLDKERLETIITLCEGSNIESTYTFILENKDITDFKQFFKPLESVYRNIEDRYTYFSIFNTIPNKNTFKGLINKDRVKDLFRGTDIGYSPITNTDITDISNALSKENIPHIILGISGAFHISMIYGLEINEDLTFTKHNFNNHCLTLAEAALIIQEMRNNLSEKDLLSLEKTLFIYSIYYLSLCDYFLQEQTERYLQLRTKGLIQSNKLNVKTYKIQIIPEEGSHKLLIKDTPITFSDWIPIE